MNDKKFNIEPLLGAPVSDDEWVCGEFGCTKKPKGLPKDDIVEHEGDV